MIWSTLLGVLRGQIAWCPVPVRRGGLLARRCDAAGQGPRCFPSWAAPAPSPRATIFSRAPVSGKGTSGPEVETFCRQEELNPPANRPFESSLLQCKRKERRRDEKHIHFKQGNFHLKCCLRVKSSPAAALFSPLSSVYQFLLTTVSWLRDKQAQLHWYYILQLQTDHGD